MPHIPLTAAVNLSNLKARQEAERRRREEQQRKAKQQRRAEEKKKSAASSSTAQTTKASTHAIEPIISSRQMLIDELSKEFGQQIVSQVKWNAMTPPRDQCIYMREQKEKQKKKQMPQNDMWTSEFGGGKRNTRKTRKIKKNKKSCSRKNNKYFFW
jgi:hypothetical protein